ncbi:ROK family protein [Bacillus swezeyi]|uniref:Sugar kinase n=1 Tax=Bacillus swezeyi TaxID=1925020 RepID=A0A1R1RY26_9BACI|nr:ROK family protein [Bacillus swezeyi]MEC1262093.1 ROK family protein [Bacillus swezeyi]MED2928495.1 ROK family protein [Bacillus swezeyi]MED2964122.1 ROK family protein [Bacillus swezeyi]MED2979012.1 ROK family protein [Bacillus swezeyi]MED3074005.1 ROK family protein [Bacillus swezeyi]
MYLAFDIGGTYVKQALIDTAGNIQSKDQFPTPYCLKSLIASMTDIYASSSRKIKGIAVSCPGTVDINTGTVYHGGMVSYLHNQNLIELLGEKCAVPITVENDAKCAALAELWLGSVKGHRNAIVLVLGSGVGGGLIINGQLHRGSHLSAGEVSYMMNHINPISLRAEFFGSAGSSVSMIKAISKKKGIKAEGQDVFDLINQQDSEAKAIFEEYCLQLAVQMMNLQYLLDPEIIAIGGGISAQPVVVETIRQAIDKIKKNNPMHVASPNVVACTFKNDANLLGALYHFFEFKQKNISVD